MDFLCRRGMTASFGCIGKSGVITSARPAKASRKATAGMHWPLAKNPCRNNIFFILIISFSSCEGKGTHFLFIIRIFMPKFTKL